MRLKLFAFVLVSVYVSVGGVSVVQADGQEAQHHRGWFKRLLHIGKDDPSSTEEEAPTLPAPPPAEAAPPPPQAATVDPLGALKERAKHQLFPLTESDEAYKAYNGDKNEKQPKTMDDRQRLILLEGACGDENVVGKCQDQLSEMDYGANAVRNHEALRQKLDKYMPGITGEDAARRVARGRVNWTIWSGGNDRFWNYMTQATFGGLDLLKTISNYESSTYRIPAKRNERWKELGLTNEPCFKQSSAGREDRFGLWLDVRDNSQPGCANNVDPFEDEAKFPGVEVGARGKTVPVGSMYGYATGVMGLRLFPNPDFDDKAKARWDVRKFYEDPNYYNDPKLIRPYRVGMACAFCHVGPNPTNPPKDMNNPTWATINSNPGAQYFWVDRILLWSWRKWDMKTGKASMSQDNFIYQLLHTSRPGALDTSLISSDQINNPRTMNAVYDLPARVALAASMGHREMLTGGELDNAQFNTVNDMARNWSGNDKLIPSTAAGLRSLYEGPNPRNHGKNDLGSVLAPRVLKDGSDSVGPLGALNRVYVNIGLFSEEWVQNFIPLVGGANVSPFRLDVAMKKSLYWQANVNQTSDTAMFFLATTQPDTLEKAAQNVPSAKAYLASTKTELDLGKKVFADTCARCHSSKLPQEAFDIFNKKLNDPEYCHGKNYLQCWNKYWAYTKTSDFRQKMEAIAAQPDFVKDNFLSNDQRVPANLLDSNLCSPVATNGLKDNVWNDFSSTSYKELPSVGTFKVAQISLTKGKTDADDVEVPAGGRGYLRPASLSSLWSTAPFLGNNSLGWFSWEGTVDGRMASFDDSIRRLLWPQDRVRVWEPGKTLKASRDVNPGDIWPDEYGSHSGKLVVTYTTNSGKQLKGIVDVTTAESFLKLPRGYVPGLVWKALSVFAPDLVKKGEVFASGPVAATQPFSTSLGDNGAAGISEGQMGDYLAIGPIPAGVPINLISNLDLENLKSPFGIARMTKALYNLVKAIADIQKQKLTGDAASQYFITKAASPLLKVSKCRDFVVNRGHYFGTEYAPDVVDGSSKALSDAEKEALIKFLKTL